MPHQHGARHCHTGSEQAAQGATAAAAGGSPVLFAARACSVRMGAFGAPVTLKARRGWRRAAEKWPPPPHLAGGRREPCEPRQRLLEPVAAWTWRAGAAGTAAGWLSAGLRVLGDAGLRIEASEMRTGHRQRDRGRGVTSALHLCEGRALAAKLRSIRLIANPWSIPKLRNRPLGLRLSAAAAPPAQSPLLLHSILHLSRAMR